MPSLFSYKDVKDLFLNVKNFYAYVNRAIKRGEVLKIKKGLYGLIDRTTGCLYVTWFQIASKLFDDAYFSYHEAIDYYGLATQVFVSHFTYLTHVKVRDFDFGEATFSAKKSNCNLEIIDRMQQNGVRVVSLERAIVDSIDNLHYAGGLEEVEEAINCCRPLDLSRVTKMLEYYDKAFLYQKVGYLFEKYWGEKIPNSFYEMCQERMGKKTRYLDVNVGHGIYNRKWRLIVPKGRNLPDEIF